MRQAFRLTREFGHFIQGESSNCGFCPSLCRSGFTPHLSDKVWDKVPGKGRLKWDILGPVCAGSSTGLQNLKQGYYSPFLSFPGGGLFNSAFSQTNRAGEKQMRSPNGKVKILKNLSIIYSKNLQWKKRM